MNEGLPGYSTFYRESSSMAPSGSTVLMTGAALVLGAIWYKMRNKKHADDEFVKVEDSNNLLSSLINPFNR